MAAPIAVTNIDKASKQKLPGTWSAQNLTKDKWIAIKIDKNTTGIDPIAVTTYGYTYYIYSNDGTLQTSAEIGKDVVSAVLGSTQSWRDGAAKNYANYKKTIALLKEFKSDPNSQYNQNADVVPNTDVPIDPKNISNINFNPPPHRVTRSPSFYDMANIDRNFTKSPGSSIRQASSARLGKIYQTSSTATALNKRALNAALATGNQDAIDKTTSSAISNIKNGSGLWGFRFLYNPTTISYSNQVDTSIDWMLNTQDPSRFFGGNTMIEIELYLIRMADLASLKYVNGSIIADSEDYPGYNLKDEDKSGIYYRGTEYDLEFLYRCVNGDPTKTSLTSEDLKTADFGYITGSPVWLHLHDNLRFKASLANISVYHVAFSDRMVPMTSIVKLGFIRYPELEQLGDNEQAIIDKIRSSASTDQSNSGNTSGKTTGK